MKIKDKLKFLIKKIKLTETDLKLLEIKSNAFDNALSNINCSIEHETENAKNENGDTMFRFIKSTNYIANIDIRGLLDALCVEISDCIQLNIIDTKKSINY